MYKFIYWTAASIAVKLCETDVSSFEQFIGEKL